MGMGVMGEGKGECMGVLACGLGQGRVYVCEGECKNKGFCEGCVSG